MHRDFACCVRHMMGFLTARLGPGVAGIAVQCPNRTTATKVLPRNGKPARRGAGPSGTRVLVGESCSPDRPCSGRAQNGSPLEHRPASEQLSHDQPPSILSSTLLLAAVLPAKGRDGKGNGGPVPRRASVSRWPSPWPFRIVLP